MEVNATLAAGARRAERRLCISRLAVQNSRHEHDGQGSNALVEHALQRGPRRIFVQLDRDNTWGRIKQINPGAGGRVDIVTLTTADTKEDGKNQRGWSQDITISRVLEVVETVEDQLSVIDHLESDFEAKLTAAHALQRCGAGARFRDAAAGLPAE